MTPHRVFVYGSLKSGFRHHGQLRGARPCGRGRTSPGFTLMLVGEYPALVPRAEGEGVCGEIYDVDAELLSRLDAFEDHPEVYRRQVIELEDGSHAQAYLMTPSQVVGCPEVTGGIWRESTES